MRKGTDVYYLHGDHLGSTSLTTDASGNPVAQARYLPYGQERWITGTLTTDFTFTGQRAERGFGLMDYNARYYDPYLNRWISADTIVPQPGDPQALNRYSYVNANPLRFRDPSGHYECEDAYGRCQPPQPHGTRRPDQPPQPSLAARTSQQSSEGQVLGLNSSEWSTITAVADGSSTAVNVVGLVVVDTIVLFGLADVAPDEPAAYAIGIAWWNTTLRPVSMSLNTLSIGSTWASGVASGENAWGVENGSYYISVSQDLLVDIAGTTLQNYIPDPHAALAVTSASTAYDVGRIDISEPIFGVKIDESKLLGPGTANQRTAIPSVANPTLWIGPSGVKITRWRNQ